MSSHIEFNFKQDYHQGSESGCVWRHAGGWGDTPCHYAMKGYSVSGSRSGMYNKDHRRLAREAGYVVDEVSLATTGKASELIKSEAEKRPEAKRSKFMRRFEGKFHGPLHYLKLHPEGWHYGHVLAAKDRMEPKTEFAFFRAVADLVLSTPSGAMEMLGFSSRADALSAIVANEPRDFEKALESVVADWKDEVEAQRRSDALDASAAATDGYVCIEGLALVYLAYSRGLSVQRWTRHVPAELRPR